MKLFLFPLAFSVLLLGACTSDRQPADATVVQVNSAKLSASEFAQKLAYELQNMSAVAARDENIISETKARVIQKFVHSTLMQAWAKNNNIFVRKEKIDDKINLIKSQYPDEQSFRQALIDANLSFDDWSEQIKNNLLEEMVSLKIRSKTAEIRDEDISAYYNKHKNEFKVSAERHLYQIVLNDEESADRVYKSLSSGAKFEKLAKEFSITPESNLGGDLGWVERGYNEVFDTAFRMRLQRASKPVKSAFGYHIFRPIKHRSPRTKPLKEVHSQIERLLLAEKEQSAYSLWLEQELVKAKVFKNDPLIRSINIATKLQK